MTSSALPDPAGLFDHWQPAPSGEVSFAAPGLEPEPEAMVFRMELPADPALADEVLDEQWRRVSGAEAALPDVRARAAAAVRQARAAASDPVSFSTEAIEGPEGELLRELGALRQPQAELTQFGLGEWLQEKAGLPPEWQAALDRAGPMLERAQNAVRYNAYVETEIDGEQIARTAITWSGDADTQWARAALAGDLHSHARALRIAVTSRAVLIRLFILTARLAAQLAAPGGAALALPGAWKYVNQVLAEINQMRQASAAA